MVLFKMLNRGVFSEIHGCVSTGKEANVYYATSGGSTDGTPGAELAIKVYKTAILVFKDRDRWAQAWSASYEELLPGLLPRFRGGAVACSEAWQQLARP
jgi:serine/threonine-protein kinase RIO1